jgi:hypothetical protein
MNARTSTLFNDNIYKSNYSDEDGNDHDNGNDHTNDDDGDVDVDVDDDDDESESRQGTNLMDRFSSIPFPTNLLLSSWIYIFSTTSLALGQN